MFSSYWKKQVLSFLRAVSFCWSNWTRVLCWNAGQNIQSNVGSKESGSFALRCHRFDAARSMNVFEMAIKHVFVPQKPTDCYMCTLHGSVCGVLLRRFLSLLGKRRENNCSWLWTSRSNRHRDPGTAGREKWPPFPLSECKSTGKQYSTLFVCIV